MNTLIITLLASVPFILLFILIVLRRWPALKVMPLVWILTAIIAFYIWKVSAAWIGASFIKGTFISLEIMLIIFGAVWIIEILKEKKQIMFLHNLLVSISPDARIQAIIIAWLFGSLIEGIAGFGTPAAITAPLLVSLGFAPILSVVLSLIANSTAVSFGAAGTPILLGIGSLGIDQTVLKEVSKTTSLLHSIAGIIIPVALTYFVILHSKNKNKIKSFIETIPFIILAWISFVIPYTLIAVFIGPELPSIIGGITGLIITSLSAHYNILTPKKVIRFDKNSSRQKKRKTPKKQYLISVIPYILIVLFLLITRTSQTINKKLTSISIGFEKILGLEVGYTLNPLYTPSFYFLLTGIICLFVYKANRKETISSINKTFNKVKFPTITLIFALAFVQLFILSENNLSNLSSMPITLANSLSFLPNKIFTFLSPFIGLFGSFVAGSNTVSNLLFGSFQAESAKAFSLPLAKILALQVIGGAIGNMIAIHNVLAASATVGLKNQEGLIIRRTLIISLIYAITIAFVGLAITSS